MRQLNLAVVDHVPAIDPEAEESINFLKPEMDAKVSTRKDMHVDERGYESAPPRRRKHIILTLLLLSIVSIISLEFIRGFTHTGNECLDMQELHGLVSSADHLFILVPAKAGGQSLIAFATKCTSSELHYKDSTFRDMFPSDDEKLETYMTLHVDPPKIIATHVHKEGPMIRLMDSMEQSSLMIMMYRNEFDRLKSAIRYVAVERLCRPGTQFNLPIVQKYGEEETSKAVQVKDGRCTIDEDFLLKNVKDGMSEIGSAYTFPYCGVYDSIERSDPNLIFAHYTQSDILQKIVAKYHCPDIVDTVHGNEFASLQGGTATYVYSNNANATIEIAEWVEKKGSLLSWILRLKEKKAQCTAKRQNMEGDLMTCSSKFIRSTGTWKVQ